MCVWLIRQRNTSKSARTLIKFYERMKENKWKCDRMSMWCLVWKHFLRITCIFSLYTAFIVSSKSFVCANKTHHGFGFCIESRPSFNFRSFQSTNVCDKSSEFRHHRVYFFGTFMRFHFLPNENYISSMFTFLQKFLLFSIGFHQLL